MQIETMQNMSWDMPSVTRTFQDAIGIKYCHILLFCVQMSTDYLKVQSCFKLDCV